MLILEPFAFCTNNVPGPALEPALDMAQRCGFQWVELSAIDGISEQIKVEYISPEYIDRVRRLLDDRQLRCSAVSGHCTMTDPIAFARLLKKIEFAGAIGAKWLNTRCGPPSQLNIFLAHVKIAAETADRFGITLNLESYGDIVGPASQCGPIFEQLKLPNVRYNYDPGNTFRFARGNICIEEDLANASVPLEYLHLKDASLQDGWIWNNAIGTGQLNYPAIFNQLENNRSTPLPCSLEIPMSFRVRADDLSFDFLSPSLEDAEIAIRTSLSYLSQFVHCT